MEGPFPANGRTDCHKNSEVILGIETSCDETAAAVCHRGVILASRVSSQEIHRQFGGVVPEAASREHERWLATIVRGTLEEAGVRPEALEAVAVTRGPGLVGTLLAGLSFARGFASGLGIPSLGINHIEAHIFSCFLGCPELRFPFLCLLVSGGHTQIWEVRELGRYHLLGETRDDAAGEAFDKGARVLGLDYPGGPAIEQAAGGGNPRAFHFPRAFEKNEELAFSFSGLKTALKIAVENMTVEELASRRSDLAASYQQAIAEVLVGKARQASERTGIGTLVIAGGVAANGVLRQAATDAFRSRTVLYPPLALCTDNAAMIAFLGEQYFRTNPSSASSLAVSPNLRLGE